MESFDPFNAQEKKRPTDEAKIEKSVETKKMEAAVEISNIFRESLNKVPEILAKNPHFESFESR